MICEHLVRFVCSPDPLEEAKDRVQTRRLAEIIRERKALVHSALARSIPTEGRQPPADHRVTG